MNRVYIEDIDKHIIIEVDKKEINGGCIYYFDGRKEPITIETLDIFKSFLLSNNKERLANEGEYKVILDKNTGLKHYFLNGKESFVMLFLKNGEEAISSKVENSLLEDNGWRKKEIIPMKERIYRIGKSLIRGTTNALMGILLATLILNTMMVANHSEYTEKNKFFPFVSYLYESFRDKTISTEDLLNYVYASDDLSLEDRKFLATKDYFDDILPYINKDDYTRERYLEKFNNIKIEPYDNTKFYTTTDGFYSYDEPAVIHIAEKYYGTDEYYDILAHEDTHRCQLDCSYNLLKEACAEIESFEYRKQTLNSYHDEVYLTKKLMEIIGPEPVFEYVHTGYFTNIKEAVLPYFSQEEYSSFLSSLWQYGSLSSEYDKAEIELKHQTLDELLNCLYERKFGVSIDKDLVIPHLKEDGLVRYYFNHREMEKNGSYLVVKKKNMQTIDLKKAMEKGLVSISKTENDTIRKLSHDEYVNFQDLSNVIIMLNTGRYANIHSENGKYVITIHYDYTEEQFDLPQVDDKIKMLESDKKVM